jgi:hypothetical protein
MNLIDTVTRRAGQMHDFTAQFAVYALVLGTPLRRGLRNRCCSHSAWAA